MLPLNPAQIPQVYRKAMEALQAGRPDEALALFGQIVAARPATPEAHFQIGRIHAAAGRPDQAETALRKALKLKPEEPAIWRALAGVLSGGKRRKLEREARAAGISLGSDETAALLQMIASGRAAEAEKRAAALVLADPAAAGPAHALGAARSAQGKWPAALAALERALEADPGNLGARALHAEALVETGQWSRAGPALDEAARAGADVARPLARFMTETCRPEEAAKVLAEAARRRPGDGRLQRDLARALAALRQPAEARAAADRAVRLGGHPIGTLADLADRLSRENEAGAALAILDELLAAHPEEVPLLVQRAQTLQTGGELDRARADLRRAAQLDPGFAETYRAYTAGTRMTADDPVLAALGQALARRDLPKSARRVMSFAMSKAMADLGRDAEMADHLHRANRLMHEEFPYGFRADLDRARATVAEYDRHLKGRDPSGPGDTVLFVCGLPRSGTTLVETILSAHSRVVAAGELSFLGQALAPVHDLLGRDIRPGDEALDQAGRRYVAAARRRTGAADIFTDKAISTFFRIGHAALALPNAQFLVLRRDPRDVGLSIYRNMFPEGLHRFSTDLRDIGRYIWLHEALVAFWAREFPERVHWVDYEALTSEPAPQIRALVAAAGLDWEDACLAPEKADRPVPTLSFAQVRQPIYRSSVAGWRRFEHILGPLVEGLETEISLG